MGRLNQSDWLDVAYVIFFLFFFLVAMIGAAWCSDHTLELLSPLVVSGGADCDGWLRSWPHVGVCNRQMGMSAHD